MLLYWNTTNTSYLNSCTASNVSTIILIFIQLNRAVCLSCMSVSVSLLTLSAVRCIALASIDQIASPLIFSHIILFPPMHPRMRYSTVQYSIVQYSTVQFSTVRCGGGSQHRNSSAHPSVSELVSQLVQLAVCLRVNQLFFLSTCQHVCLSVSQLLCYTSAEESQSLSFPPFFLLCLVSSLSFLSFSPQLIYSSTLLFSIAFVAL